MHGGHTRIAIQSRPIALTAILIRTAIQPVGTMSSAVFFSVNKNKSFKLKTTAK